EPPGRTTALVCTSPVPLRAATLEPAEARAVQVTPVRAAGTRSSMAAPSAVLGPLLVTTMVYSTTSPARASGLVVVLLIDRLACGVSRSVSVALSLPGVGSVTPRGGVTVAVLDSEPVAPGSMLAVTV